MPDLLPKLVYHPVATFTAAAIVATLLGALFARGGRHAWLPPLAIGVAAVGEATAGLWAAGRILTRFRALPVRSGVGPPEAAATILDSRYPGEAAAIVLLALSVVALVFSILADRRQDDGDAPPLPTVSGASPGVLFGLSAVSVVLVTILMVWDVRQTSWIVRSFANGPIDFTAVLRVAGSDIHGRVGLSLGGMAYVCAVASIFGISLQLATQRLGSRFPPTRWFVHGSRGLLAVLAFASAAHLASSSSQRTWLRATMAKSDLRSLWKRSPGEAARLPIPPCTAHPPGTDVAEIGPDYTEPIELRRFKPYYPERARLAGEQGEVLLEAVVAPDGRVRSVCTLRGVSPLLDEAAAAAVREWIYEPAKRRSDGAAVASYLPITVKFTLK